MRRILSIAGIALLSFLMWSVPAFSQTPETASQTASASAQNPEGSNQGSGEDENAQFRHSGSVHLLARITGLSDDGAFWLAVLINFAIVVGLIAWLWRKNVPALFRNRTASIQKAIEEARRASEDANRRLSEIDARLGRLGDEINQMRATAERDAAAEEERIKAAAEEEARRIGESAVQEIAAAAKSARRELTAFAADLAVSLAAKQIHVDTPADQALVRLFAQQLAGNGAPGKKS
jgi:F-type H+-transporting ATPase subunit b